MHVSETSGFPQRYLYVPLMPGLCLNLSYLHAPAPPIRSSVARSSSALRTSCHYGQIFSGPGGLGLDRGAAVHAVRWPSNVLCMSCASAANQAMCDLGSSWLHGDLGNLAVIRHKPLSPTRGASANISVRQGEVCRTMDALLSWYHCFGRAVS